MTLGKRILSHRKRLGLTQEQLAEKLGVTSQAVSKWENDQSCPDITVLPQLAEIFGISTDELLGRTPQQPVYTGEVVNNEEDDGHKFVFNDDDDKIVINLHSKKGKLHSMMLALFVLFTGVVYLLTQFLSLDISFWNILWPSALMFFGIDGLISKFSFIHLVALLIGAWFLASKLFVLPLHLNSGIIFAIVIVLFGVSLLVDSIRKANAKSSVTHKVGVPHIETTRNNLEYTDQGFRYSTSFGESHQIITLDTMRYGEVSTSFGDYTVDLTGVTTVTEDCKLDASCSFGELTIRVPRRFGVRLVNSTAFADIHTEGTCDASPVGYIAIEASASFGEIVIQYI